jgi:hypothetical protein
MKFNFSTHEIDFTKYDIKAIATGARYRKPLEIKEIAAQFVKANRADFYQKLGIYLRCTF